MNTIYKLTGAYLEVLEIMNDEDQESLFDTLSAIDDSLDVKLVNYAKIIKNLESQMTAIKTEEERLAKKRKSIDNKVKFLKSVMTQSMTAVDKKRVDSDIFTIALQKSPPKVMVTSPENVPAEYKKTKVETSFDLKKIGDDLKAGEDFSWAELRHGQSLRIK